MRSRFRASTTNLYLYLRFGNLNLETMKLYVTNVELVYGDDSALRLYGRDEEGRSWPVTVMGFRPYFYVNTAEAIGKRPAIESSEHIVELTPGQTSLFGDRVTKIECRTSGGMKELKGVFDQTYEAEVWYTNRARIDLGIYTGIEVPDEATEVHYSDVRPVDFLTDFRVMTYDIETDDRGVVSDEGDKAILSIVAHDSFTDEYTGFVHIPEGQSIEDALPGGLPE